MRWFGGPKHNIEALVEAHYAVLYRYGYRLSGSSQEAEDLTQETFCQARTTSCIQLRDENRAEGVAVQHSAERLFASAALEQEGKAGVAGRDR